MPLNVEVALVANPAAPFEPGPIDGSFYAQRYDQRTKVSFQVEEEDSLASALERAATLMNLRPPDDSWMTGRFDATHRLVLFHKPEDEHGPILRSRARVLFGELTLVDKHGRAIFGVNDLTTVRFLDLLRSAEAGTIEGDPVRPYLILDDGWGDAPPVDWAAMQLGLEIAWEVAKVLAVATGAVTGLVQARKWLVQRLDRGRAALRANPEWAQRGYRPDQFESLLASREWDPGDAARLLGCTAEQAEGTLFVLGYVLDETSQRWRFKSDDAGLMLSNITTAIGVASHRGDDWRLRFRRWMERYLEDGELPAMETLDLEPGAPSESGYVPTIGERVDEWLGRIRGWRSRGP